MVAANRVDALDLQGNWLDSAGHSIFVSESLEDQTLIAVLTPLVKHPDVKGRILRIEPPEEDSWHRRIGKARLEYVDTQRQRLVWVTRDGLKRNVWIRSYPGYTDGAALDSPFIGEEGADIEAFPWLLNNSSLDPWLPLDVPRDILYDGARVAALLDIRQMIGARSEPQERLTHILMDHDLHPARQGGDYLIPNIQSPLWQTLNVSETTRQSLLQRISQIPSDALTQRISWSGDSSVWVGRHKISVRARDVRVLEERWVSHHKDERKPLEIARLLALYSIFDNPLSHRRSGLHLGLDPVIRRNSDFELFASPLNAAVPNGRFSSKWPHVEWRFGSIGSYPSVLEHLPVNSVLCINPPFTEAYLADVMARLPELKLRFRLRIAVPILEAPWRKKLQTALPVPQILKTYYDATAETPAEVLHPTLLWEDPRCPPRPSISEEESIGEEVLSSMQPQLAFHVGGMGGALAAMVLPVTAVQLSQGTSKETSPTLIPATATPLSLQEWPALEPVPKSAGKR